MGSPNTTSNPYRALELLIRVRKDCGADLSGFNFTAMKQLPTNSSEYVQQMKKLLGNTSCHYTTSFRGLITSAVSPASVSTGAVSPVLVAYHVLVVVFGLLMNLCVISTIFRARRLWTITNSFVLSLSFADLLMAGLVGPLYIQDLYIPQGSAAPVLDTMFPLLGVASLLSLGAVTVDRFLSITRPLHYDTYLSKTRATVIILAVWIVSVFQAVLPFAFANDKASARLYQDLRFALAFSLPFLCVVIVNGRIFCVARTHARQISMDDPSARNSNRGFAKKMKTVKVIGVLVGAFVISWVPYFVLTISELHLKENSVSKTWYLISTALVCGTALFNPLLYGMLRKDMREAIVKGLKCQNVNQVDDTATHFSVRLKRSAKVVSNEKPKETEKINGDNTSPP